MPQRALRFSDGYFFREAADRIGAGQLDRISADPQLWFNTLRALKVRHDFMPFCGLSLQENVSEESTPFRFRNALPSEVCCQLEGHGLKLKQADSAIIDASLIERAARPRSFIEAREDRHEEGNASDTGKGGQFDL